MGPSQAKFACSQLGSSQGPTLPVALPCQSLYPASCSTLPVALPCQSLYPASRSTLPVALPCQSLYPASCSTLPVALPCQLLYPASCSTLPVALPCQSVYCSPKTSAQCYEKELQNEATHRGVCFVVVKLPHTWCRSDSLVNLAKFRRGGVLVIKENTVTG